MSHAAVDGLDRSADDPGVARVVYLLAHTVVAARTADFPARAAELGIDLPDAPTLFDLTAGMSEAIRAWHASTRNPRTDLAEMAELAAAEALTDLVPVTRASCSPRSGSGRQSASCRPRRGSRPSGTRSSPRSPAGS
ncbi:hypothetical protein [Fimbriiglobus ruber]|uniref:Uncharacterized protein n=1 Tax=Fimbriiglobus ruber TaxID=1908690 RepID=A0A225DLI6_9BACT|nr:hypothetical protein [Fimbriiglobus ruber]OWK39418.1 hypothetical protein FRUB_05981 [Fimbriiglobus ruber]